MTVLGHIHQGVIVLDHAVTLPEGATVEVRVVATKSEGPSREPLAKYAGIAELPENASERIDEVLYGAHGE